MLRMTMADIWQTFIDEGRGQITASPSHSISRLVSRAAKPALPSKAGLAPTRGTARTLAVGCDL